MNLAICHTRSIVGIHAQPISVEVHLSNGLPGFSIVGLPEAAVKESKERVRSAILNSHFDFPCRRITVNLAPANIPKLGSGFDLPIALGILAASQQINPQKLSSHEFLAELALDGSLRGVNAVVAAAIATHFDNKPLIIANHLLTEVAFTGYHHIFIADSLKTVCDYLCQDTLLLPLPPPISSLESLDNIDWSDIKGQQHAKFALEIAACGGHSALLSGSPGSGKTMLAKRFVTLLPDLSRNETLTCLSIHAAHGRHPSQHHWHRPIFRSPHHTASATALVGGGNPPKPGEISLAHHGVLFLDELPEFNRQVLESLREPLEAGNICISRANIQTEFPAKFQLIAAMNPCPCGHYGNDQHHCSCSPQAIQRYMAKLSGPFLDRIDLFISIHPVDQEMLLSSDEILLETEQISHKIRLKNTTLRATQIERQGCLNAYLDAKNCEAVCQLGQAERLFLKNILKKNQLSARGLHRTLKVARTIADWRLAKKVEQDDLLLALSFRFFEKDTIVPQRF